VVADAGRTPTGASLTGTVGVPLATPPGTVTVATFTDGTAAPLSDFTATIAWGDGLTSPGIVQTNTGGGFKVVGNHTYGNAGTFSVTTTISETQALAFPHNQLLFQERFLSVAVQRPNTDASSHDAVWHGRAAVLRLLLRRQEPAQIARLKSDAVRRKWEQLAAARRRIHYLVVQPSKDLDDRDRRLAALEVEQSKLERELARLLPELDEHKEMAALGPNDLAARLPKGTVFLVAEHRAARAESCPCPVAEARLGRHREGAAGGHAQHLPLS
jgi:hypothetical protein